VRNFRVIVTSLVAISVAVPVWAQCPVPSADACQKAADLLNYMTPQLSTALASGNPTLGQGGTLGGLGHFSLDIRGSAVNGSLPQLNSVSLSTTGAQNSTFTTKNQFIPAASLDAGVGLWRGYSLGITHVGGVDGIVTMTYLPNISNSGGGSSTGSFTVNGSNEKFGYGFRLGLLEESAVTPGVSFAWVKRDLPTVSFVGTVAPSGTNPGGTLSLNDFSVNTTAWRVTAAKSFLIFGLSLGAGRDTYDATSSITATVGAPCVGPNCSGTLPGSFTMTRTNYFVGAYVNVIIFKLEGEFGEVTGGTDPTYNTFTPDAAKARSYFTLGLRFAH
jgi:hypothetical protein